MEGAPATTKQSIKVADITTADKVCMKGIQKAIQRCANKIDKLTAHSDPDIGYLVVTADLLTQAENTAIEAILLKYAK
jgi:hypothetical protein